RSFEQYQNFVNLRTVVWGVGLTSLLLDLFALANLDFLNVLLLLPSLMFSVSTLVGPFIMRPKPGKSVGWLVCIPKVLGWVASFVFYMILARLISAGGWFQNLALLLCVTVFGRVAVAGLSYVGYSRRLQAMNAHLAQQIVAAGLAEPAARKLAD